MPARNTNARFGTYTSMPCSLITLSESSGPSTSSNTYCKPEHPPPCTAILSLHASWPSLAENCNAFAAALGVTCIVLTGTPGRSSFIVIVSSHATRRIQFACVSVAFGIESRYSLRFKSYISVNSISTKRGDKGETSLLFGGRVSKADPRVEAYGMGDMAVSALGMARASCQDAWVAGQLLEIQRKLFTVNAQLATDAAQTDTLAKHFNTITDADVAALDNLLADLESQVALPRSFVIPGASQASAAIDLARTVVRTVERRCVEMQLADALENPNIVVWLNRLSDCLFMLARYVDRDMSPEILTGARRTS